MPRERWGSKLGVILAVAGSAVGLGNFLRFPGLAAKDGGGAFLIPYFISLLLLGLPLMWIEWTIGRFGGGFGHSTAPGIFYNMTNKNRFIKYFGIIGIFGPIVIFAYYTYIESWLLGYTWFAMTGQYHAVADKATRMAEFNQGYLATGTTFGQAFWFFVATFLLNIVVVWFGIRKGIESVCKYALPLLLVMAAVLLVRVLTLPTPEGQPADRSVAAGLNFLWEPRWEALASWQVWLDAAGQVFFTLSVGIGVILTYASYLRRQDDVALSGLTAAATNETAEVILGGMLVVPAAVVFLGLADTQKVAEGSIFGIGFITMPMVLDQMPGGQGLGVLWFGLLFLAGITSSISLAQPAIAFIEDEFGLSRQRAVAIFAMVALALCLVAVFGFSHGVVDDMDLWGGRFALVLFGAVEVILFAWVFGMDRAWTELHAGSDITIPRIYRFVIRWVTPVVLLAILIGWGIQKWGFIVLTDEGLRSEGIDPANRPYLLATRLGLLGVLLILAMLVKIAWRRRRMNEGGTSS
jgi:SNF family Na+-dependent transporter